MAVSGRRVAHASIRRGAEQSAVVDGISVAVLVVDPWESCKKLERTIPLGGGTVTEQISENFHSFLFGPQISYRKGRLVPFAHLLVGESRVGEKLAVTSSSIGGFTLGGPVTHRATTTGTAAMGAGVDYSFGKNLAWRVQADSLLTAGSASNVRISTGLVFRLGR